VIKHYALNSLSEVEVTLQTSAKSDISFSL